MLSSMAPNALPMGTVPRVLVRRTASPAYADFGGLSSVAALVVVRLDVVMMMMSFICSCRNKIVEMGTVRCCPL